MKNPQDLPGGSIPEWTLGDRLRKARTHAGLEMEELADDLGVTSRTVSNYETDQTRPKKPVLLQYAMRTGVPLRWIATGLPPEPGDTTFVTIRYPVSTMAA